MQKPLISILTPFKNTAAFLPDCIISILKQTYTNWELIAVNDSSSDNSLQIVQQYAKKEGRIKVFNNEGSGIIPALQVAFSKSSGTYITRMDSDDIMHVDKLKVLLHSLQRFGKKHVAIGLVNYFSNTKISNGYARYEAWLNTLTKSGLNYTEIYKECVIPSPCWMLHRNDFLACNAFYPNRYPEDYDLTFRLYENKISCIPCNTVLHYWRDYATRTSRTHIHYAQNYFLELKMHYFLKLDFNAKRPLTVWGAGFKGKTIAKYLLAKNIPFYWICNNEKKIGKKIYQQPLWHFHFIDTLENPQCIVTVANAAAQHEIKTYFKKQHKMAMQDYFFFC